MSCLCGDTACPSCGPAQGHDPAFEAVCEWIYDDGLADFPPIIDRWALAEELANRLNDADPNMASALESAARAAATRRRAERLAARSDRP